MNDTTQVETLSFEAEVKQLLHLVAHSLYSNKEIFLRELISNSSDAADKLRQLALTDAALYEEDPDLKIWVDYNKDNHTITVRDNGIGMNREEAIENLGTIARSGTQAFREYLEQNKQAADSQLIGQFGVGFYSTFIVADNVVVRTRRAGLNTNQGVEWQSKGQGEYTIRNIEKADRGTEVVLHLKKEEEEFLDDLRLRNIIQKYSDHILLPILMKPIEKTSSKKDKESEKEEIVITDYEVVNRANALWTLSKNEIKEEEYQELYKHIAHDFENPLAWAHNKVEGSNEYTSLLYLPARASFDLYHREMQRGLKLYVKRVFIMDDAEHFMPMYLRFVKGIIDSNDLPLNISRELLQSNKTIERIRSACIKRILDLLEQIAEKDKEKYAKFWLEFGQVLKEGPAEDYENKDKIAKLLRFSSTKTDSDVQEVTLDDYVKRMQENQKHIFYVIADTFTAAKNTPLLELFRKKGIEVLLLHDRVDEWLVAHLREYQGKELKSISQGKVDLSELEDEATKQQQAESEKEFVDVVQQVKKVLEGKVKEVRITHRLTDSPACVVFDEHDMTGHMMRMLKAAGQEMPASKPILELNPNHPIIEKVKTLSDDVKITRWANVLLDQALLAEGETLQNPAGFVKELNALLVGE